MTVYRKSADFAARRARVHEDIDGRLAMYRLLRAQREYCGLDPSDAVRELERAEADRAAHLAAPPGTHLVSRVDRMDDTIWILGEGKEEIYCGPRASYESGAG